MYDNIVLIPYRDRESHLNYFINNSIPLFKEHLPNSKVVVIEQNKGKLFNRGKILNVGFDIYKDNTKCFITHDVDINPTKQFIYKYNININKNNIQGLFTSICNSLGGIIKIRSDDIFDINGFPNNFWGWGAEDIALQKRAEFYKKNINKFLLNDNIDKSNYLIRFNDINDRQSQNNLKNYFICTKYFSKLTNTEKEEFIMKSGLNNIEYKILKKSNINNDKYIDHIIVDI